MLVLAPSVISRLATEILILGLYVKLLFIPYPLLSNYAPETIKLVSFTNIGVIISLLIYISIAGLALYRIYKDHKDRYAFGILFFCSPSLFFPISCF
jgi:hypothetical protein